MLGWIAQKLEMEEKLALADARIDEERLKQSMAMKEVDLMRQKVWLVVVKEEGMPVACHTSFLAVTYHTPMYVMYV